MTQIIPKGEWAGFLDDLTKKRFEWLTRIEVFGDDIGSQVLADGLSLTGVTFEERHGKSVIRIIVGNDRGRHQTHNINDPAAISYFGEKEKPSGIVEIKETDGTKTLVHIIQPMPLVINYSGGEESAASG